MFRNTKRIYSETDPFLDARALGLVDAIHVETVRRANLATFMTSVLGSQDVGFYHLNASFLDTFIPDGQQLLKSQADLFLELKTQAYISAVSSGERTREQVLEDLLPENLEQTFIARKSGVGQLTPTERAFLKKARDRRKELLQEPYSPDGIRKLPEKYVWADFLRAISGYIGKAFNNSVTLPVS